MCPSDRHPRREAPARPHLRSAFDVLDADRDGKISSDDLRSFYAGLSGSGAAAAAAAGGDEDVLATMMAVADANSDGFVEYEEFERVLSGGRDGDADAETGSGRRTRSPPPLPPQPPQSRAAGGLMGDVFRVMDKDGDGRLSCEDLRSYMAWAGLDASEDEIKAMIRLGGGSEAEGVSLDGLVKVLAVDDGGFF
ncbi:calcium-binding protein CP1 [Eucalyptus grandis]|uniref:calcium-binding protein CP1 n=1 Tax=Eucalyptus grandis TaxID=71139 RepID=UPI00192EB545|nr:calcium-binding protein CP1 [Eucalyptus grandis]